MSDFFLKLSFFCFFPLINTDIIFSFTQSFDRFLKIFLFSWWSIKNRVKQ